MLRKLRMIQLILSQTVSRPICQDNIYRFSLMCFRIYMPSLTSTLPVSKKKKKNRTSHLNFCTVQTDHRPPDTGMVFPHRSFLHRRWPVQSVHLKMIFQVNCSNERRTHNTFMSERKTFQDRYSFICTFRILTSDMEEYIFHPSPQSDGRHFLTRCGLLVRR